jgi:hypothetical protein
MYGWTLRALQKNFAQAMPDESRNLGLAAAHYGYDSEVEEIQIQESIARRMQLIKSKLQLER